MNFFLLRNAIYGIYLCSWYKKKSKEFQVFALETSVIGWLIWGLATSGMQSFVTLLDSSLPLSEASRRNTIHTVCHSEPLSFMWALLSKVSLKMSIDLTTWERSLTTWEKRLRRYELQVQTPDSSHSEPLIFISWRDNMGKEAEALIVESSIPRL